MSPCLFLAKFDEIRYHMGMNYSPYLNPTNQEKAVPSPRRLDGPSEQSYRYQLGIDVPEMLERCFAASGPVRILDIGGYHATAASDAAERLSTRGKPAEVTIIDLPVERATGVVRPGHTTFV
jgi:hypothetical protein